MKRLLASGWALFFIVTSASAQPGTLQSFQLPNGLRVVLLENHERALLRIQLRAAWPASAQALTPASLAPLALRVLGHCGAGASSHDAFCRKVEEQGIQLNLSSTPDGPVWTLLAQSTEAEVAFGFMADATSRVVIDEGGMEAERMRCALEMDDRSSSENAREAFLNALDHPDVPTQVVTSRDINHIFLEAVQNFIQGSLGPSSAVLAISGDVSLAQARQLALLNFGAWAEAEAKAVRTLKASAEMPVILKTTVAPLVASDHLLALPFRGADRSSQASAELLALLLPRKIKQGKAWIHLGARRWVSLVVSLADQIESVKKELQTLKEVGLGLQDLKESKILWKAQHEARASHPQNLLQAVATDTLLGPAPGQDTINAVDLAAFNATLRTWLNLEEARILSLGPEVQGSTPKREAKSK